MHLGNVVKLRCFEIIEMGSSVVQNLMKTVLAKGSTSRNNCIVRYLQLLPVPLMPKTCLLQSYWNNGVKDCIVSWISVSVVNLRNTNTKLFNAFFNQTPQPQKHLQFKLNKISRMPGWSLEKKIFAKEPQLPSIVNTNSQMLYIYCPKHSFSIQDSISTRFKLYLKKKCPADFLKIFGKKIPTNNKSQELFMYPESRCSWCTRSIFIFLRELNTGP